MLPIIAAALCLFFAWFLQGQRSVIRKNGRRLIRPPGTLPLAGNGIWFLQPRHRLLEWFSECERRTGFETYEISVPSMPPGIVINDPQNVEHVLRDNQTFIKGKHFRSRSWDLFGNGIINADGELWKVQRKAGLRFFSVSNLKRFVDEVLPPILEQTHRQLDCAVETGEEIDLQSILLELTTRFMGQVAYEMDIPASLPFSQAFDFASGAIGNRFQNPFWKATEWLWGAPLRRAVFEVKNFGKAIVSNAARKRESRGSDTKSTGTDVLESVLIDSLLDHISDKNIVADAAMNFLSAGRDTTAQSLTWTLYMLMRHPEAYKLLVSEVNAVPRQRNGQIDLDFDSSSSSALPYTAAVFIETLRLYPPVPVELKECTCESSFPDGVVMPEGAIVMWIPWSMGRSRGIWGPDADEYRPERWLSRGETGIKFVNDKTAFEFPVFNAGPRSCLGKKMAEALAVTVLASLVQRFHFKESTKSGLPERQTQDSLTLPMEGGLPCFVELR